MPACGMSAEGVGDGAGVNVDLFRPDDELKRLARLAVSSGVADRFCFPG